MLTKKLLLYLVPAVLISSLIHALIIFYGLKGLVLEQEQAILESRVNDAAHAYQLHSSFASQFLYAIQSNQHFREFLSVDDARFSELVFATQLEESTRRVLGDLQKFSSLSILRPDGEVLYYYENSLDPFNFLDSRQRDLAKRLFASALLSSEDVVGEGRENRIVHSSIIDRYTFAAPPRRSLDTSVMVQVAVETGAYGDILAELVSVYGAAIYIGDMPPDTSQLPVWASASLGNNQVITVWPSEDYLFNAVQPVRITITLCSLMLVIIVLGIPLWLIRNNILAPINELKEDLQKIDVLSWAGNPVAGSRRGDEIGVLAGRFEDLMARLSVVNVDVEHLANHDALTKLPNRQAFNRLVGDRIRLLDSDCDQMNLLYIDLDNFKYVNDRYGHDVGDALLASLAERIRSLLNIDRLTSASVFARLAGDEFAIAFPANLATSQSMAKLRQILALFSNGYHFDLGAFPVSASIGVSVFPQDGYTVGHLVTRADSAMYQARQLGKNQMAFYSNELEIASRRQYDIELALKSIDFDSEFRLDYMPVCDQNRKVVGCEALLRWRSPTLGDVQPDLFIPIAESTGMFRQIDFWVLENAINDFPRLEALFGSEFLLSCNISSAEMESVELAEFLDRKIRQSGIDASRIELELTETFAMTEGLMSVELLDQLVAFGFQIAIDDFGTGNTSLLQLIEYPVHKIKFDRLFVNKLMASSRSELLEPLISLCHSQGFFVTAEGIENEFVARYFAGAGAGCDFFQGFHYSKPKSLDELIVQYQSLGASTDYRPEARH